MRPVLLDLLAAYHAGRTDFPLARLPEARLQWALECGLAPVVARCCADDPGAPSHPQWNAVRGSDLAARVVVEDQAQATIDLIEACAPRVGPLILLKGVWLSHAVHPEPHLRPMRDVDVMVEPGAAREVERVLIDLGYRPTKPDGEIAFRDHNHLVPYQHPDTGVLFEVHHALMPPGPYASERSFSAAGVREHLRPASFRGHPVLRLSNELQVAYLSAHWAGSLNVVGGGGGLVIMLDLPAFARDVDWERMVEALSGPASATATFLILSYLQARGLLDLPAPVLPAVKRRQRSLGRLNLALLEALIDRRLVDGRPYGRVLTSARNFDTVWMALVTPRPALVNLLALPWSLLPLGLRIAATPMARPLARAVGVKLRDLDGPR